MKRYYYTTDGNNVDGPVSGEDLQSMIFSSQIETTTQVCLEGTEQWMPVSEVTSELAKIQSTEARVDPRGYVSESLNKGERVIYTAKVHWGIYLAMIPPFIVFQTIFIGILTLTDITYVSGAFRLMLLIPFLLFIRGWLVQKTTELSITNKRVITKVGLFSRQTSEILLPKVESVEVDQGIFGRMLNYGTVTVRGTGGGVAPAPAISDPLRFRKEVQRMTE